MKVNVIRECTAWMMAAGVELALFQNHSTAIRKNKQEESRFVIHAFNKDGIFHPGNLQQPSKNMFVGLPEQENP